MRFFLPIIVLCVCLVFPERASADAGHYASWRSFRRGNETQRVRAAAQYLWDRSGKTRAEADEVICRIRRLLPRDRGSGFANAVVTDMSSMVRRARNDVSVLMLGNGCFKVLRKTPKIAALKKVMSVDQKGAVLSSNAVWNACVRGLPLTAAFMKGNPDTVEHRQRRMRVRRPLSCRDYHRGDVRVWRYPDDPLVELALDERGRLLGDAPPGYVLQKVRAQLPSSIE